MTSLWGFYSCKWSVYQRKLWVVAMKSIEWWSSEPVWSPRGLRMMFGCCDAVIVTDVMTLRASVSPQRRAAAGSRSTWPTWVEGKNATSSFLSVPPSSADLFTLTQHTLSSGKTTYPVSQIASVCPGVCLYRHIWSPSEVRGHARSGWWTQGSGSEGAAHWSSLSETAVRSFFLLFPKEYSDKGAHISAALALGDLGPSFGFRGQISEHLQSCYRSDQSVKRHLTRSKPISCSSDAFVLEQTSCGFLDYLFQAGCFTLCCSAHRTDQQLYHYILYIIYNTTISLYILYNI